MYICGIILNKSCGKDLTRMSKNPNKESANPAVKSMVSMAFYLVLLIGMWAILAHVMFPDRNENPTYAQLVTANEPLLAQVAENIIDPEQWAGIQQTSEVQALYEKLGVTGTRFEDGQAKFILAADSTSPLTTCISFLPDGDLQTALTNAGWKIIELEGASSRWEKDASYTVANQLTEKFYLAETNVVK